MALTVGTRLGPYEIRGSLGAGGMGEVYRAYDPRIGREVAIKVLPAAFAADPDRLRRFEQEIQAIGLLNHPNILTIHDTGATAGTSFIVTELLDGQTLRDRLDRGPLRPAVAIAHAVQIAKGLAAAHARGIVHRDLKPENLFVCSDGQVKILDFGIAKLTSRGDDPEATRLSESATAAGVLVGTMRYMSPEQVRGVAVDRRSDLFSLGIILYEMLSASLPFGGASAADSISAVLRDEPAPLPESISRQVPGLDAVIGRCLEKDPARRIQSAQDLAFHLETLGSARSTANAPTGVPEPVRSRARTLLWPAVLAIAAAGVLVSVWLLSRNRVADNPSTELTTAARVTPFLASDALESQPAWSPAGNLIAYVSDAAGNSDIWISDPSGSNPINLTASHAGVDSVPVWSPDGGRLAFYSARDEGGIFTMNALGSDVRKVLPLKPGVLYALSLTWSRDGSLVFTGFDDVGAKQVYRVSAAGGTPACLTCGLGGGREGEISPSGELLLYKTSEMGARGSLLVQHLASRTVTRVVDQADRPRWTDDGHAILFISGRDGTPDLWEIRVDPATGQASGDPRRLTSGLNVTAFTAAKDARQILVATGRNHGSLWSLPGSVDRVTDLSSGERLTTGQFLDARARWLPKGTGVVFQSNRRGSLDIWSLASGTSALARLTTGPGTEHRPRPAPDGKWLAFDQIDKSGEYVHVMRPDGSGIRLPDEQWRTRFSMTCCADWSPDGKRIAMHVNGWTSAIARIDPATGAAIETIDLDLPGGADEYHRWSPDGRFLAYEAVVAGTWDLWIVNADGSDPRPLTSMPGNERTASWHPRLPFVFFHDDDGVIWRVRIDAAGRPAAPPEIWLTPGSKIRVASDGLDFTPDGDRLLVTILEAGSDIWLLER